MSNKRPWWGLLAASAVFVAAFGFCWLALSVERHAPFGELRDGLREPSAVAVVRGSWIAVADIGTNSVSLFGPDGGKPKWVRSHNFDHPTGLGAGPYGVWVADTGNSRVAMLDLRNGKVLRSIDLDDDLRPTDVARTADGSLWISASPDETLLRLDPDGNPEISITEVDGVPLLSPRGLAADGQGGVFVCSTLGGRVLHLDARGALVAKIGQMGLGAGRFAKPKDVALLAENELAVLDSQVGMVQVMDREGAFLRLLASGGEPLRFEHPLGLAGLGDGLTVADAGTATVHVISNEESGAIRWDDFPHPMTLLRASSFRSAEWSGLCRQCHDGTQRLSIGNWDPGAYQHPWNLDKDESYPEEIVLGDRGELLCSSCHEIHREHVHTTGDAEADADADVVIDADREATTAYCEDCHTDRVAQAASTGHALGKSLPRGADRRVLLGRRHDLEPYMACRTCHTPHGARYEHLLVASGESGELCRACHTLRSAEAGGHPMDASNAPGARSAISTVSGVLAANGRMTCLSCHASHDATADPLLRFEGGAEGSCQACHADLEGIHSEQWHPDENCIDCHSMHEVIRPAEGSCGDCHEHDDQQALADRGGHGDATCVDCHPADGQDPNATWLPGDVNPISRRCLGCHDGQSQVDVDAPVIADYDHPLREVFPPDGEWASEGRLPLYDEGGQPVPGHRVGEFTCTTCHVFHGPEPGATSSSLRRENWRQTCATCHGPESLLRYQYFHDGDRREL
jgi:predicted CXXCH cytochrome family protein